MHPVGAKALIINAFAPTGRIAIFNPYTQGAALGYVLIGLSARIIDLWHALLLQIAFFLYFRLLTLPSWAISIYIRIAIICTTACAGYGGDAIPSYIYTTSLLLKLLTLPLLSLHFSLLFFTFQSNPLFMGVCERFCLFCFAICPICDAVFLLSVVILQPNRKPIRFKSSIERIKIKNHNLPKRFQHEPNKRKQT